jgi:hypothetical protein
MKAGAIKLIVVGCISMVLIQIVPVYYHTMEFNRYVQQQVPRIRSAEPIQEAILSKAEEHHLPVTAQNIGMSLSDSVLRVNVEYEVPVNFYVFHQDLKFSARGSALMMRSN